MAKEKDSLLKFNDIPPKQRVFLVDWSVFVHRGIFAWRNVKGHIPATYYVINSVCSCLKKLKPRKEDLIILAIDSYGKGNWRRDYDPCLPADTELLTATGWKSIKTIVESKDKTLIATLNDNKVEYRVATDFHTYKHKGKMIHLGGMGHSIDILMTPEHQHYVADVNKKEFSLIKAKNLKTYFKNKRDFPYQDKLIKSEKFFKLPKYVSKTVTNRNGLKYTYIVEHPIKILKMDSWLKLLGWYLSEGCCGSRKAKHKKTGISISQSKTHNPTYCSEIRQILNESSFNFHETDRGEIISFNILNTQLAQYMETFGKSKDKYIPRQFLNLNIKQSKILLNSLLKGDGTKKRGSLEEFKCYTTISKQLADDVQELALKCGYCATISKKPSNPVYTVNLSYSATPKTRKRIEKNWEGVTYDITIPNHVFFIRRNGKVCWTGNCYKANRKESRDKCSDINWSKQFEDMNELLQNVNLSTQFIPIQIDRLEADDIISYCCRYFKDSDITILTTDSDMNQLYELGNVKIWSPVTKKIREVKNPLGELAKKIQKETTDNLITPITNKLEYERRKAIVTLLTLPDEIDEALHNVIKNIKPKEKFYPEYMKFEGIKKKYDDIFIN